MENKWYVKAIQVGSIAGSTTGPIHYCMEKGENVELPIWIAAATNGEHKVLVDTGIGDDLEAIVAGPEPNCRQKESERTAIALKNAMGWDVEDVDIVINTHLHYDHCGYDYLFKNAKIYLQRKEYAAAMHPIPSTGFLYYKKYFSKETISYFQWKLLDGETEILPGLVVIPTPGHTVGHQSVLFDTDQGTLCIAGDVAGVLENINDNRENSIVVNSAEVFESFAAIRDRADRILPGHEYRVPNLCDKNFPLVK